MQTLNDLQRNMLVAIRAEAAGIEVTRVGDDMLLVRAGEQRWYGKQAVAAVVGLMVQGLLTRIAGRYELTETGGRVARTLKGPAAAPRPTAPRPLACARCKKALMPRQLRCSACGARVAQPGPEAGGAGPDAADSGPARGGPGRGRPIDS